MLGLSPPRIFQCRNDKALDGPTAMGNPVVSVGPIFTRVESLSLRSHSRQRASVLPNIREWLLPPGGFAVAARAASKVVSYWPRRAIRDNVCAATRMAQSERSRPSQDGASPRGLQGAFKHSDPTDDLWFRRVVQCPVACAEMRLRQPYMPRFQRACLTSSQ